MGKHAELKAGEVPFAAIIDRIEALRSELSEIKPAAKTDPAARAAFAIKTNDLRGEYARLAAAAADKVANWWPDEQKLED